MPIKSYLAYPKEGMKESLETALSSFENCEVIPSKNHNLIVLVTETTDKQQEELLQEKLHAIDSLKMLSMVSGFNHSEI